MIDKNTVYTVTPPDLRLTTIGPTVLLLGLGLKDSEQYIDMYEKLFPEVEITFFVGEEGFTTDHTSWYRAVTHMASTVIVNIDNITPEEMFLAMQVEHDNRALVFWVSEEKKSPALISLINSYQIQIFDMVSDIEKFLVDELEKS